MTRHLLAFALAAAALTLAGSATALAGGFATVTVEPLAGAPRAGEAIDVGFTARGHGITPFRAGRLGLALRGPDGRRIAVPARESGPVGHYVATLRLPAAGDWRWEVVNGAGPAAYTFQDLGTLRVASAARAPLDAAPAASAGGDAGPGATALGLLGGAVAALALLAARLLIDRRRRAVRA
ncbi:MAG: hypothetical protein AB7V42_01690 [Thermoleophilia bacterium]